MQAGALGWLGCCDRPSRELGADFAARVGSLLGRDHNYHGWASVSASSDCGASCAPAASRSGRPRAVQPWKNGFACPSKPPSFPHPHPCPNPLSQPHKPVRTFSFLPPLPHARAHAHTLVHTIAHPPTRLRTRPHPCAPTSTLTHTHPHACAPTYTLAHTPTRAPTHTSPSLPPTHPCSGVRLVHACRAGPGAA